MFFEASEGSKLARFVADGTTGRHGATHAGMVGKSLLYFEAALMVAETYPRIATEVTELQFLSGPPETHDGR